MKTIKNILFTIVSVLFLGVLSSCTNNTVEEEVPIEPLEPRMIHLGFDGLILIPSEEGVSAKSDPLHTYITDGYNVQITGGVAPEDSYLTNVDLTEGLSFEVTGDIVMTVSHPNFYSNNVLQEAFYGIQSYTVPTGSSDHNIVPLNLVQGFVMVTSDELAEPLITSIRILGQPAELDVVYYIDAPVVDVLVETDGYGTLRGEHNTELGEGVQYNVTISDDGIEFTFPEFGDPGDGEWGG